MIQKYFIYSIVLLVLVSGCGSTPPTVGKATEFTQACDQGNDGERVAVEGYLKLPDQIPVDDTLVMLLEIRPSQDVEVIENKIGVWTHYGSEANQVAPVDSKSTVTIPGLNGAETVEEPTPYSPDPPTVGTYTHADLHVTANDGQPITYTDRVRVSGEVALSTSPQTTVISPCVLTNPLIELVP